MKQLKALPLTIGAVIALVYCTTGLAATIPKPGYKDPRVREVTYDGNDVIQLTGYEGYQTHLKFAEDEIFVGLGSGDTAGIDVASDGNDTWIKPKAVMVRTNFDVKTNRRVYHFDYQARRTPPKNRKLMIYSINFRYPQEEAKQRSVRYAQGLLDDTSGYKNRDYWYCGNPSMQPVEADDNGIQTRIKFNAYGEFPAIYVENPDETEALVNFNVDESGDVIIHRIAQRFILRRGDLVGCIENRQFTGGGKRLDSQTTHQGVVRQLRQDPGATDE